MRAVVVRESGGTDVLRFEEVVTPIPGRNDVLIEVAACGVCTLDIVVWPSDSRHTVARETSSAPKGTIFVEGKDSMGGNAIPVQPHGELKRERIARLRHHHQLRKPRSRNMR